MSNSEDAIFLLSEWFEFWKTSDSMPAKMPNSLHTRTVVCLVQYVHEYEGEDAVSELLKRLAL